MSDLGYSTELAIQRTVMAADRTLMAWIRTALSMISFGFTIYKVIDGMQDGASVAMANIDGRQAGLVLSGMGTLCIVIGIVEYFMTVRELRAHDSLLHFRYSLVIAGIMLMIGVTIFLMIWTRLA